MKNKIFFYYIFFILTSSFLNAQTWDWGREGKTNGNGGGSNYSGNVAVDKFGNTCFTSDFEAIIEFGTDTLRISNGLSANCFLVKYDSNGNVIWVRQPQQGLHDYYSGGIGITEHFDNLSNIYWTGYFSDSLSFGSFGFFGIGYPYHSTFLAKYTANGNVLWAIDENLYYDGTALSIATDAANNVFIMGICAGSGFTNEYFIIKYNKNGTQLWTRNTSWASPSTSGASGYCITADKSGSSYVTGCISKGSVAFGNDTLKSVYTLNAFLVKYDSSGNLKWAKEPLIKAGSDAANASSVGRSVSTDNSGNIYITGVFYDTLVFGSYTLIAPPGGDSNRMFLVKYDTYGNVLWAKSSSIGYLSLASSLTIDSLNHIYMGGTGYGDIKFENVLLHPFNLFTYYNYIIEFDTSGKALCSSLLNNGASNFTSANGMAIASDFSGRYIYLEGADNMNDTLIAGPDTLVPNISGGYNSYLVRWIPCNYLGEGINALKIESGRIKVFPNPSTGIFTLSLSNSEPGDKIEIYNVLGEQVYVATLKQVQGDNLIDLTKQPNGIYLYRVLKEDARPDEPFGRGSLVGSGKVVIEK